MSTERSMTRRFVSLLLLAILVAVQALPVSAQGMACRMTPSAPSAPSAPSKECARCDASAGPSAVPALAAGSCCRFESPRESSTLPGVLAQSQRVALDDQFGSAVCPMAAAIADRDTRAFAPLSHLSIRSTAPPSTSTTRLQL